MLSWRDRPVAIAVSLATLTLGSLAAVPAADAGTKAAAGPRVTHDARSVTLRVPPSAGAPGYSVKVATESLTITTTRGGRTVLATAGGTVGGLRFRDGGTWQRATRVTGWSWKNGVLRLDTATTRDGVTAEALITPKPDRYALSWSVKGGAADRLGLAFDLKSAGHWYGHGETATPGGGPYTDQPWPLDAGDVHDDAFGPASYEVVDPFWYTSSATGLLVDTDEVMDVAINDGKDGLGRFTVDSGGTYNATVFVEADPFQVYRDHTGVVGKPAKSDATYTQFAEPLWNSWAQFYTNVDQAKLLDYAQKLHDDGIPGHTIQLDDRWESNYGNLTFDTRTFPDARAMSDRIHAMGYDFGIWVTLWINLDSTNYRYAADHGYLLKDKADPAKPCTVSWWNGTAGIVDLANPDAKAWYVANLKKLMSTYRVDGFKFDTRFFDDTCAPDDGYRRADYQRLGAQLADQFDLQGAGIRVHWSGSQQTGFVIRQVDKGTGWDSLAASVAQNLAISTIGYPFVETDMVGGSLGQPAPTKEVLIRWAQAASLMPLMYSSTSPAGTNDTTTGKPVSYDQETIDRYRDAVQAHGRLAPYIWDQVRHSVATGDPIMRPLFFDFPKDARAYTVNDEWMLGPAVLAAPKLSSGVTRDVFLPTGTWFDVNRGTVIHGPVTLRGYSVPLDVTPAFVDLKAPGAATAIRALK
ncbi:glycoside hydrolase family 31 protein [Actinoallomurus sp. WRP6H-15]|nr:glycoside hydrolase family 31 protein [Actinoallomurus soli]